MALSRKTKGLILFAVVLLVISKMDQSNAPITSETSYKRRLLVDLIRGEMPHPDKDKYWNEVLEDKDPRPKSWCGALILWALRMLGYTTAHWIRGIGFISPLGLPTIKADKVQIGDIAYFKSLQHQATVSEVLGKGRFKILNGNAEGGAITESETNAKKVDAFYSIEKLLA